MSENRAPSSTKTAPGAARPIAMLGNPNTGKSTLFARLCGVRTRTANFPGSTVEAHIGNIRSGALRTTIVDLPGLYGLNLDRPESKTCRAYLSGEVRLGDPPATVLVVADATNLERNLLLVSQALQEGLPAIVALTMWDSAQRRGIEIDVGRLQKELGCPVIPVSARTGAGLDVLASALVHPVLASGALPPPGDARVAADWAKSVAGACVRERGPDPVASARVDSFLTNPFSGLAVFLVVMGALFYAIFAVAAFPMDMIENGFALLAAGVSRILPEGPLHDLIVDGIIGGIAGTVVFLPQICLLFFLISLLEDTGYLARAVFLMDRLLRRFGLPGQAFVPLLSAHACAIPAIMSARLIPSPRDRLATILIAPFMSCSARLPVYVLLVGVLFRSPFAAGVAFLACYAIGLAAALLVSLVLRATILPGRPAPLVMELPGYKMPSLRTALATTLDRAGLFLRKAGTVIVGICVILWWCSTYPTVSPPPEAGALRAEAALAQSDDPERALTLQSNADRMESQHALASSFVGRVGRAVQPVFSPLGLDWRLTVGVLTSFAAREVFVSTMAVITAGGEAEGEAILDHIRETPRDDGSDLLTARSAASLLAFYILAMQCLPTLAVTAREAGGVKWALLQLAGMSLLAYVFGAIVYFALGLAGVT